MSKAPDLEELARRYLELWQNQFASMAADPEFAESMGRMFNLMGAGASGSPFDAATTPDPSGPSSPEPSSEPSSDPSAGPSSPVGAETAGAASRGGRDDVARLARRVAELEKRLAALEGRMGKPGGGSRRKPRPRKS